MASIHSLPREILLKIFSYYMETETQLNFIKRISHVCQAWEEVCRDSSLWHSFDGTLPLYLLIEFCKEGRLRKIKTLKFSNCKKSSVSEEELRNIYGNLPLLESINFSGESRIKFFTELTNYCPDLYEITLRSKCLKYAPPRFNYKAITDFLKIRGSKLITLDFSCTSISRLEELFVTIASACPNLKALKTFNTHNIDGGHFPIVCMQKGLKKLEYLFLGDEIRTEIEVSERTDGFPNLETFIYIRGDRSLTKSRFKKLLMKSVRLKELDISGSRRVSKNLLCRLPTENLESLYVCVTKVYESTGFIQVLQKWGNSLITLDVSFMLKNCINSLFCSLISHSCLQNLETLYLNNTAVTISTVKLIIQNCSKLKFLDLRCCRDIGRGRKREYAGETKIRELLNLDN